MKKSKRIYSKFTKKKLTIGHTHVDAPPTLNVLESAWNNLPNDLSLEEREVFYEITAKLIKLNTKIKEFTDTDLEKN